MCRIIDTSLFQPTQSHKLSPLLALSPLGHAPAFVTLTLVLAYKESTNNCPSSIAPGLGNEDFKSVHILPNGEIGQTSPHSTSLGFLRTQL